MEESILVFDTETISLDKPYCYNIGYIIADKNFNVLVKRDYVVEQIWHNLPLFNSAYYSDKRQIYISRMKAKKTIMEKYGYICQQLIRDIKNFNVVSAYAYNSKFDDKVFNFNCDYYKCNSPFDNVPIFDILGYAQNFIVSENYKKFCEKNSLFTDSGNYSTTAETMTKYITNNIDFMEEHTALKDSEIELEILKKCIENGATFETDYETKIIKRKAKKSIDILLNKNKILTLEYTSKCERNGKIYFKNEE